MIAAPLTRTRGFSVVEIIVGAAIVAVVVTGIASAWSFYEKLAGQSVRQAQADLLIEEGAEALQYLRDKGWSSNIAPLSTNTTYYIVWNGTDYVATTTQTASNGYARTLKLAAIYRDASDNIAASGTVDPDTLLATLSAYPTAIATGTPVMQAQTLIHNVFNN